MDEGWTRWVLEQYEFTLTTLHNADIRAGRLRQQFDAIILPDQNAARDHRRLRRAERSGPSTAAASATAASSTLKQFVAEGGTLVTLGAASRSRDRAASPIPVRNLKRGLTRDQHFAPGTILRIQVDTHASDRLRHGGRDLRLLQQQPVLRAGRGLRVAQADASSRATRTATCVASGWLRGEELMAGRAAVVSVDMNPGRIVLFGLRPQHRAQTHATFPLLFNALYLSAAGDAPAPD